MAAFHRAVFYSYTQNVSSIISPSLALAGNFVIHFFFCSTFPSEKAQFKLIFNFREKMESNFGPFQQSKNEKFQYIGGETTLFKVQMQ